MWYYYDPEELKNYQCKSSLKSFKEYIAWNYGQLNGTDLFLKDKTPILRDNLYFTGISSNPLMSLAAHGVDLGKSNTFVCSVIPVKYARELKAEVLAMKHFAHDFDDASDYIAEEQPYTYLYSFLVEKGSVRSIDTSGFSPLKYIPSRPAQIFVWHTDGSRDSRTIETKDRDSYPEILKDLLETARTGKIARILLKCQESTVMQCDFREGGYGILFDAQTSQSGYVYRYLPEKGRETDWNLLYDILLHFLRFYKKQRGTKWKYVQETMAYDECDEI